MTDEHDHQHDDEHDLELRALLGAADPAASLRPADPDGVARLLEDTMTDPLIDESRIDGTRDRSRLTWLVAAAAVLLIAGGVLFATQRGDDEPAPQAGETPTSESSEAPTVTELGFDAAAANAKCIAALPASEASVGVLQNATTAFDGTVDSVSGSLVTLTPTTWYAGDPTDQVVVQAPGADLEALLTAVQFEEGGRYLVSAVDDRVTVCQFSAAYSPELAALYEEAFAG